MEVDNTSGIPSSSKELHKQIEELNKQIELIKRKNLVNEEESTQIIMRLDKKLVVLRDELESYKNQIVILQEEKSSENTKQEMLKAELEIYKSKTTELQHELTLVKSHPDTNLYLTEAVRLSEENGKLQKDNEKLQGDLSEAKKLCLDLIGKLKEASK